MDEFLLIFRRDNSKDAQPSPEQMQASIKPWQDWLGGIAAQNKLARTPQRWDTEGRIVKHDKTVINGPYAEIKEAIGGLLFIKADSYEEAADIAKGCPILDWGGNVEIRRVTIVDE
jgi:hypothetical protein